MSKVTIQMSTQDWQYVSQNMFDWYGFKPSVKMLKKVLKNERDLVLHIADHGNLKHGMDTIVREQVADEFAFELVRAPWPIGSTGKAQSKRFFKAFEQAANQIGMKCEFKDMDE